MTKDEARHLCKTNRMFLGKILGYDFQEDVHPDMFDALARGEAKNRLILWPRGHFKTTCVTVDVVANVLTNPDARILTMQGNLKLSKGWLSEIRSHFGGKNTKSRLLELFPEFEIESGDAFGFTVKARQRKHLKEPTCVAASPKAISTGQHYSDAYFDDLVHANNFRNVDMLDKLENEFQHYQPLIDPGGYVTVTGTRYSFADIYQRIIKRNKGEWVISVRPCYKEDGTLLFPERVLPDGRKIGFTVELLAKLKRDDPETFSAQYLNQILVGSRQIFPSSVLLAAVKSTLDKDYPVSAPCVFLVDLAESKKAESDNSVVTVARLDQQGRVWVTECLGDTWSPSQLATIIMQQALVHRPVRILLEKQPGTMFFAEYLRTVSREKGLNLPVDILAGSRQKDAKYIRIAALESSLKNKRLFLCAGIHDFDKLSEEFEQFPRGRHDDRPDCIALAVGYLTQNVFISPERPVLRLPFEAPFSEPERSTGNNMMGSGFVC